jgi:hypothetical protein
MSIFRNLRPNDFLLIDLTRQKEEPKNNPSQSQSGRNQNQKNCCRRFQFNISNGQKNMPKN